MNMNIRSNKKYLLLIPLVVSVIMLTFFSVAYDEIVREKREQKFRSVQRTMDLMMSQVDRLVAKDDDWRTYDYTTILLALTDEINAMPMVFVELYDHNLTPLTDRNKEKTFDLLGYPEFLNIVRKSGDRGPLTIEYDDGIHSPYEMDIYIREIPTGDYDDKLISVIGVSEHSIEQNFAPWLIWGMAGLVLMTVILQLWMIFCISKLSDAERVAREKDGEAAGDSK